MDCTIVKSRMVIDVNSRITVRLRLSQSRVRASEPAPWWWWWRWWCWWQWEAVAAAAECVDVAGCWSAGVYDACNAADGSGVYLPPVAGRFMAELCCISPFYVLSNVPRSCFSPLIYEWKLLDVELWECRMEREREGGGWGGVDKQESDWLFCPSYN